MKEKNKEFHVLGPPGTGKTTYLVNQIGRAREKHGQDGVLVVSFTKAAASEISARVGSPGAPDGARTSGQYQYPRHPSDAVEGDWGVPGEYIDPRQKRVGTLHAICYHLLGRPEIAETKVRDWNEWVGSADMQLAAGKGGDADEPEWSPANKGADKTMRNIQKLRATQTDESLWPVAERALYQRWNDWKAECNLLDFTDMVETCLTTRKPPPSGCRVAIVDEAQDFTRLELALIRHWSDSLKLTVMAYDDDQCQPAGTMVTTTTGPVRIEDLQSEHRVVSFDRGGGFEIRGRRKGYEFKKAKRSFAGLMSTVTVGDRTTRCTPNHKWLARWSDEAKDSCCVYLMRRGDKWRVGWCQVVRLDGGFHLSHRARLEKADAAWVLKVFKERGDASIYESFIACKYGIPQVMFEASNLYTVERLAWLFGALHPETTRRRALACLGEHAREELFPFYTRDWSRARRGGSTSLLVHAANLLPSVMLLPTDNGGKKPSWERFTVERSHVSEEVYSLSVQPHEFYIADGVVTHNSLYSFKGATPLALIDPAPPDERRKVLEQSYRVPKRIHRLATDWITQVKQRAVKEYRPTSEEGRVEFAPGLLMRNVDPLMQRIEDDLRAGLSVMVLTSCSYMLSHTITGLRSRGIPFHNPYRTRRGDWNPLRRTKGSTSARLWSYLRRSASLHDDVDSDQAFTASELWSWAEHLNANVFAKRGMKGELKNLAKLQPDEFVVEDLYFAPEHMTAIERADLGWFEDNLMASKQKGFGFTIDIAKRDPKLLSVVPKVTLGTIHSVKGGEADSVYVFPDVSPEGQRQWFTGGRGHDDLRRLFYVAFTRAKKKLVLCDGSGVKVKWDL